jgi:GTPase SAR1 family protein
VEDGLGCWLPRFDLGGDNIFLNYEQKEGEGACPRYVRSILRRRSCRQVHPGPELRQKELPVQQRLPDGTPPPNQTQGSDILAKIIPLPDQPSVELFLFDLSGHEFYESIALGMSKNPDLVMVVYDCTNQDSLSNSLKWLDKVKKLNNKSSLKGVLVGAKSEHKNAK